jgi:hypothetical protein
MIYKVTTPTSTFTAVLSRCGTSTYYFSSFVSSTVEGGTSYFVPDNATVIAVNQQKIIKMELVELNNHYNGTALPGTNIIFNNSTKGTTAIKETQPQTSGIQFE